MPFKVWLFTIVLAQSRPFTVESLDPASGRPGVSIRSYQINSIKASRARDLLLALPDVQSLIRPDQIIPGRDDRQLVVIGSDRAHRLISASLAGFDTPRHSTTGTIPLSFISFEKVRAVVDQMGPDVFGGLKGKDLVYLPSQRTLLVRGSPASIDRLRSFIARADLAPQSVQIGLTSTTRNAESSFQRGLSLDPISVDARNPSRIGGRVVYADERSRGHGQQTVWVTTLDGSPARFGLGEIFNVVTPITIFGPGTVASILQPREVFVGTNLSVTPVVRGRMVEVEVGFSQDTPTRVGPLGVDRATGSVITRVMVPRGGEASIGGLLGHMKRTNVINGPLFEALSRRGEDTAITIHVK